MTGNMFPVVLLHERIKHLGMRAHGAKFLAEQSTWVVAGVRTKWRAVPETWL
jgi:hypothetical protein